MNNKLELENSRNDVKRPDLVLIEMSELTSESIDFIEQVQRNKIFLNVPFVVILKYAARPFVRMVLEMEKIDILVDPIDREELINIIKKNINSNYEFRNSDDGFTVIALERDLIYSDIEKCINHLIKKNINKIIFDLKDVLFLDSSRIASLIIVNNLLNQVGGKLKLKNL